MFTKDEGNFSAREVLEFVNLSIGRSVPRWSRRLNFALDVSGANAIILLVNDLENGDELMENPIYHKFVNIVDLI